MLYGKSSTTFPRGRFRVPTDSLPLERLVEAVNAEMKVVLGPLGKVQTSRLTGAEAEGGAEPDPKEPMPPRPQAAAPGPAGRQRRPRAWCGPSSRTSPSRR